MGSGFTFGQLQVGEVFKLSGCDNYYVKTAPDRGKLITISDVQPRYGDVYGFEAYSPVIKLKAMDT